MSSLAPIRRIPAPTLAEGSVEADVQRLIEACRSMERRDELIRSLRERGLSVKQLVDITETAVPGRGVKHQRIYQILQGTNGHQAPNRGGRNGSNAGEPAG